MYSSATGKLFASTSIYGSISDRSTMAVSDDDSIAIIQERDDTFGHNKLAAYRYAHTHKVHETVRPLTRTGTPSQPDAALILLVC
jgi:hypothetical protein